MLEIEVEMHWWRVKRLVGYCPLEVRPTWAPRQRLSHWSGLLTWLGYCLNSETNWLNAGQMTWIIYCHYLQSAAALYYSEQTLPFLEKNRSQQHFPYSFKSLGSLRVRSSSPWSSIWSAIDWMMEMLVCPLDSWEQDVIGTEAKWREVSGWTGDSAVETWEEFWCSTTRMMIRG